MKRKYQKIEGWWVYVHKTPNNMYYVGQSKRQIHQRWQPSLYHNMSLHPYIEQYGWENIEHLVVKDGLTEEQALYWEDLLIQLYSQMGCCINKQRSGNCTADIQTYMQQYNQRPEWKEHKREYDQQPERKEYQRQYNQRPERKEYQRQYMQQCNQRPEYKIYNRVKSYNITHPDKIIETPLEAKQKYLATGYIPGYIKKSDLI